MRHAAPLLAIMAVLFLAVQVEAQNSPADPVSEKGMSREDRIKLHQARIDRIIKENEKRRQEEGRKAAEAAKSRPAGAPVPGGTPMPAVPVVTFTPQKPQQAPPAPQATAPKGARSESRSILYFRPYDSIVNVGDTFETDLVADTKDGSIDSLSVLIHYPTDVLNPLYIEHTNLDRFVENQFDYSFDPDAGEIYLKAPLKQPTKLITEPLVSIAWEAIAQTEGAEVRIVSDEKRKTGLFLSGMNVLGTFGSQGDGVIHTTVMIRDPKAKPFIQKQPDSGILVATTQVERPDPSMRLRLRPSVDSVHQGELFHVDVRLLNSAEKPFDHVRLMLKFDPKDFEVVDWDYGNWIRSGINAQDGFAHERLPFDFHKANEADNKRGTLIYDAATETQALKADGTLIKVRFRALRPVDEAAISLVGGAQAGPKASDVSYLRKSVLTAGDSAGAVLDTASLIIEKPRPGRLATPAPAGIRGSAIVIGGRGKTAGGL